MVSLVGHWVGARTQSNKLDRDRPSPVRDAETTPGEIYKQNALIEAILLAEYETVQAEFDRAKQNPDMYLDINARFTRYIEATARLRKFLAYGEIPGDVVERLNVGEYESFCCD
jgi:hypothetical protein